jgi:ABC-type Fe3+ transport system substrate-binding protein
MATLTLVAAACQGAEQPPTEERDLSGQSVEVAAVWTEGTGEQQRMIEILDAFEASTGATAEFTSTGDDIASVLGPRIEGGDPPDVAILPQPGLLIDYAEEGSLIEIEDAAGDEVDANYASVWRELGSVDGTLYGVWFKAANKSTFWYNVNVFNDAGVEPPATWEDLQTAAQTVSDSGVTPYAIDGASGWVLSDWFENIYIRVAGPEGYDQLTTHEIQWTDQTVKDSLALFAEVVGDEANVLGGTSGTLQSEFPNSVTQTFADPPKAGMVYEGDFVAGVITTETEAQLGADADFFNFPAIEGSAPAVVGGGDVVVLMQDTEAGKALIEFLATPEAAEIWAAQGGFTSPNQNVDLSVYPDDITRRSAEALTQAESFRFDLSDLQPAAFGSTTGQGIWGLLQEFVRDPDVDKTAEDLEKAAARAFG